MVLASLFVNSSHRVIHNPDCLLSSVQVNVVTVDGITPLYNACISGSVACVSMLLDYGANPELETQLASPLHEAVIRGNMFNCHKQWL